MGSFESINPATETAIQSFRLSSLTEIDSFLDQSQVSFHRWRTRSVDDRMSVLRCFSNALENDSDRFSQLISLENGKPLWESRLEVLAAISKIELSIQAYQDRLQSAHIDMIDSVLSTSYKPIGTLAVLGPFNFPLLLPLGHIIPALLVGNVVLFKPSDLTSLVAQECVAYLYKAGVPDDVFHLVLGGAEQGQHLVSHPKVQGVLFTGGYQTAQAIAKTLAITPEKMLALECGGNNPFIVSSFSDCNAVVECLKKSAFLTTGQRCTSMRRLILIRSSYVDRLLANFLSEVSSLTIGSCQDDPEPFMGPLISANARDNYLNSIDVLRDAGGICLFESNHRFDTGYFVTPAVFDVTSCYQDIPDVECFGPLLQVIRVDSLEEAVLVANQTSYGLSASLISTSSQEFDYVYHHVRAGIINWNKPTNGASSQLPFGGIGRSGNFRPAGYFSIDSCVYPVASIQNKALL
ncbi:N-succinylglutamate 5-semialdehyde dehydrogenase [Candidatus Marinamargulisbacteria bacterium SCGC AG-333-B06]|nr:N-succinylglutamate 5-semialdehyde dehydrogenase [Candidatus Marinamargulisbacteria bacterium SCGC AG-333-B06]